MPSAILDDLPFFLESLVGGLLVGVMYALVALGFVIIYKTSRVINFGLGEFMMFGGLLVAAAVTNHNLPLAAAVLLALAVMTVAGLAIERVVLRPLQGRGALPILMATVGVGMVLKNVAMLVWGSSSMTIPLPLSEAPLELGPILVQRVPLAGAVVSLLVLAAYGLFLRTPSGVALRAVADNVFMAQAFGVNIRRYTALTWATAGGVATLGGVLWGNMIGVDVQMGVMGTKVLPAAILGGLTSIPGAVVGGLIMGASESLSAAYLDSWVGGGIKDLVPYLIMIVVLIVRPTGLFGDAAVERM